MSFTRFLSDVSVKPGSGLASPTITVGYYGVFWEEVLKTKDGREKSWDKQEALLTGQEEAAGFWKPGQGLEGGH